MLEIAVVTNTITDTRHSTLPKLGRAPIAAPAGVTAFGLPWSAAISRRRSRA